MKSNHPLNLILLGDPAAGKATHAKFLCEHFNMYDLDMGKELRRIRLRQGYGGPSVGKIGSVLQRTLEKGKLTPTEIVRKILYEKIRATPKSKGILFDGTPKMIGEAKLVAKWLREEKRTTPMVVYMSIPMSETVRRMTQRKEDFKGKFSKRADDDKKALQNRVKYYRDNITHVVNYFKTLYPYKKISSNAPVPKVRKILVKLISDYAQGIN